MKNAYAVSRLRKKTGYTKKQFYDQAFNIYKEVNKLMAQGDTSSLRKALTDSMHSTVKNEIKRRESKWKSVHLELVEPAVSIRTLRAR
uniref:Large ribosomal subunit protein mL45 n=2 Tax=Aegilops tauschii TaxID=37682 RepID=A0A453AWJ0_AEGTS